MNRNLSAAGYDSWYATARGAWMGNREAEALIRLGEIGPDRRVLDVGCGSGWFTRRFAATGASVTGLDNDAAMLDYAHIQDASIPYISGDMLALPFPDKSFDVITAVTSLCFVPDEHCALAEIVRVARRRIVLGLLHRDSLLYLRKHGRGAYAGARWHTRTDVATLVAALPGVHHWKIETLLFWPGGPRPGRVLECLPGLKHFGGFMAVGIELSTSD
ncbi:MAG: class I SAM-dependent methyltransferase [Pseudomonadota bacterium]|jgi:SAM-dependent methyltransferase